MGMQQPVRMADRVVFVMSAKYAQRRGAEDVADQLRAPRREVELVLLHLHYHQLVQRWGDGQWGLTSSGNAVRNRLTSVRPPSSV